MASESNALEEQMKVLTEFASSLTVQLIDVQAMFQVLLDIERERLVSSGRTEQQVSEFLRASFAAHRQSVVALIRSRLQGRHIQVDIDATDVIQ